MLSRRRIGGDLHPEDLVTRDNQRFGPGWTTRFGRRLTGH